MHKLARNRLGILLAAGLAAGLLIAADSHADPMRPDTLRQSTFAAAPRYRVNAVIVSDERRIAIVNGKRVGVGDTVNEATVVAINKAEVIVEINGEKQSLRVSSSAGQ